MKIKIESDIFDIVNRVKEIDEDYYILYDDVKKVYELHNLKQLNTYCLTILYDSLDSRVIDLIYMSNICNIDKIVEDIDNNNEIIDKNNRDEFKSQSDYMLREIYNYASNSSKYYNQEKAFSSIWR